MNELKGRDLSQGLQGTYEQRMQEEKTILLKMVPGKKPTVVFTGFWNGHFIKAAMDSVARAYRLAKWRPTMRRENKPQTPEMVKQDSQKERRK